MRIHIYDTYGIKKDIIKIMPLDMYLAEDVLDVE